MVLLTLLGILIAGMVMVSSLRVGRLTLSDFERQRRHAAKDTSVATEMRLAQARPLLCTLQQNIVQLCLLGSVAILIIKFGWAWGIVAAIVLIELHQPAGRIPGVASWSQRLYEKIEPGLVEWLAAQPRYLYLLSGQQAGTFKPTIDSKHELTHLVKQASHVLSRTEQRRIIHSLDFMNRSVQEIMTPRDDIVTIKKTEILGPLVLHDLHETGHGRFPVIGANVNAVYGILNLRDVLTIDTNRRHTALAETAMEKHVFYIHEHASLEEALRAFLQTHHHMLIVINDEQETVGLLTIEDVVEAQVGEKLTSTFTDYDNRAKVAQRSTTS